MRTSTRLGKIAALLVLSLALTGAASAQGGAGGLLFGLVQPSWNPSFMPRVVDGYPELEFMGGFGYGVTRDDFIIGGFGFAFLDDTIYDYANWSENLDDQGYTHVAGGVGGVIIGSRIIGWPSFHLDVAARVGLGGMGVSTRPETPDYSMNGVDYAWYGSRGYFIGYAEPYVEAGVGITNWFHVGATLSYPMIANLIPGRPIHDVLWYSPSLGVTLSFGKFHGY